MIRAKSRRRRNNRWGTAQNTQALNQTRKLGIQIETLPLVSLALVGASHGFVFGLSHLLAATVEEEIARAGVVRLSAGYNVQVEVIVGGFDGYGFDNG